VSFYIKNLGLDRWFSEDNMVWDNGAFPGKPAPDIYRLAAAKLGLSPSECLVYEDGTSGILAANRAEATKIAIQRHLLKSHE
jgi:HAD superfamily hydrolase (TIGR01509 family)